MTFSFIRRAYKEVYRSFVRLMGVSQMTIGQNEDIFTGMLGFIDGHVYYNLGSWYRLLALMPAYQTNRRFMEKMMGLKEPAAAVSPGNGNHSRPNFKARCNTILAAAHIVSEYLRLKKNKERFTQRLGRAVALDRGRLKQLDIDALCRLYRSVRWTLSKWDAPLVNDFFAMIFFGVYQKLNGDSTSYHSLIEGLGNVISAQPPRIIKAIASLIKDDHLLIQAMLQNQPAPGLERLFRAHTEAYRLYNAYLSQFGDRAIGELKLESPSVRENPALLLSTIGAVASALGQEAKAQQPIASCSIEGRPREQTLAGAARGDGPGPNLQSAVRSAAAALKDPTALVKIALLPFISERTRQLIAGRENLRFARTRVFGLVRDIMLTIADRLAEQNIIDDRRDIFYLEVEEVLGFVEGGATCKNLRGLIALRRDEEARYETNIPDRIACRGAVGLMDLTEPGANNFALEDLPTPPAQENEALAQEQSDHEEIKGLPACAGKRLGRARVITDPANEHLLAGEILVAERTDPGWIMHFALCRAIVTSYGSMLSHTAIVARELKIPAVVAASGASEKIATGDLIEVDGAAGTVKIISRALPQKPVVLPESACA